MSLSSTWILGNLSWSEDAGLLRDNWEMQRNKLGLWKCGQQELRYIHRSKCPLHHQLGKESKMHGLPEVTTVS